MGRHILLPTVMVLAIPVAVSADPLIDLSLDGQVDFRRIEFSKCFEQPECKVEVSLPATAELEEQLVTVTMRAERSGGLLDVWREALLYWDPVDGVGVIGGGQNDEIDFDERIVVSVDESLTLGGIWFSDMFVFEQVNYGASSLIQDDLEAADVVGFLEGEQVFESRVTGEVALPDDPFNALFGDVFQEEGDLLNRLLIEDGEISILLRDPSGEDPDRIIRAAIGNIDPEKLEIFDGVEVVDIDVETLLGVIEFAPLLAVGEANAFRLRELVDNQSRLVSLQGAAREQRLVSDIPNGEVGVVMNEPASFDEIVFTAEVLTSNDYSVAGLVVVR